MQFPAHARRNAASSPFLPIRQARGVIFALLAASLLSGCGFGSTATSGNGSSSAVLTPTQRPAYIFVAIGASETFGTGADRPATQNWPTDLSNRLPQGAQVINLGIPGITAPEALQNELPEALDAQPNLVTVWLGTNDIVDQVSLADYQQSLDSILSQLQQQTRARVAVANIPDLTLLPRFNSYDSKALQGLVGQWNQAVKQEIAAHGDILLDVYSHTSEILGHPEYLSGDGLHPSTQGYQQIAAFFYQVLHKDGVI
ncbi:MAG TPA: SGNH/GDSL hydrolase family protein [Ktedonobacterales bacterium]|nr:SGNH/GDSL hydrolase family protein [Ktedonobacterales bacterium]